MWFIPLIMAAVGAATGIISAKQKAKQEQTVLRHQKDNAWDQYMYGQRYADEQFGLQKGAALNELAAQSKNIDAQMGLSIDDYNTSLLGQAYGIQDARVQNESGIGMSFASEGASGTRGSSTNEALRAYASQSLERNVQTQESQNRNQLNSMVTGANQAQNAIARERASWMPGGFRDLEKEARDAYNRDVAMLGQSDFDWAINQTGPTFTDYATMALGGASTGFGFGESVYQYGDKWGTMFKNKNQKSGGEV
jgi:hypothetical protein